LQWRADLLACRYHDIGGCRAAGDLFAQRLDRRRLEESDSNLKPNEQFVV
jgi:hypothetical protein